MADPSFVHEIRVRWADCDPARIAYTGRVACFALEAIDAWWEHTVGDDWYRMNVDDDIGVPFVHMSIDFRKPVTPRHVLECEVRLLSVGGSSVRFQVSGMQDGDRCFKGEFVEAFVRAQAHVKTGVPDMYREKLLASVSAQR